MKDRIKKLMEKENITPAQFSEMVGIQRSAVSHLVTGRNSPSLDVAQKILNAFRTINSDWLILGVGPMYRLERPASPSSLFEQTDDSTADKEVPTTIKPESSSQENISNQSPVIQKQENTPLDITSVPLKSKTVNKIIVYYSDSTYEEFNK